MPRRRCPYAACSNLPPPVPLVSLCRVTVTHVPRPPPLLPCSYERSGTMHGLFRVRGFTQDDAHIFCLPNQVRDGVWAGGERRGRKEGAFGIRGGEARAGGWEGGAHARWAAAPPVTVTATAGAASGQERQGDLIQLWLPLVLVYQVRPFSRQPAHLSPCVLPFPRSWPPTPTPDHLRDQGRAGPGGGDAGHLRVHRLRDQPQVGAWGAGGGVRWVVGGQLDDKQQAQAGTCGRVEGEPLVGAMGGLSI